MLFFTGQNFTSIYHDMLQTAASANVPFQQSRIGPVKDLGPAVFEFPDDTSRLVCLKHRALNPFFALAEFSWIVTGSRLLNPLKYFVHDYEKFSDDGTTINGAYGYRLRHYLGIDQIESSVSILRSDPMSRRVVLTMWSIDDLTTKSKDIPCHTNIYLKIRAGKLDFTVLNRSNDLYLGVPYDVFVFSLFHEFLAGLIGCEVGAQRHFVDSLHLYESNLEDVLQILRLNTPESILAASGKLETFDTLAYVKIDHNRMGQLNFEQIDNEDFRNFFLSYKIFKETNNYRRALALLPYNDLGYAAYLWFANKRSFPPELTMKRFEQF